MICWFLIYHLYACMDSGYLTCPTWLGRLEYVFPAHQIGLELHFKIRSGLKPWSMSTNIGFGYNMIGVCCYDKPWKSKIQYLLGYVKWIYIHIHMHTYMCIHRYIIYVCICAYIYIYICMYVCMYGGR